MDTVKTVLAGFVGIRRRTAHDQAKLNPVHLVVIAVLFVALFVLALRILVGMIAG